MDLHVAIQKKNLCAQNEVEKMFQQRYLKKPDYSIRKRWKFIKT